MSRGFAAMSVERRKELARRGGSYRHVLGYLRPLPVRVSKGWKKKTKRITP
jgi:hypothetical protein